MPLYNATCLWSIFKIILVMCIRAFVKPLRVFWISCSSWQNELQNILLVTFPTLLYRLDLKYSRYFQLLKKSTSSFRKAHQVLSETVATAPHSDAAQSERLELCFLHHVFPHLTLTSLLLLLQLPCLYKVRRRMWRSQSVKIPCSYPRSV